MYEVELVMQSVQSRSENCFFRRRKLATADGFRSAGNEQDLVEEASDGDGELEGEVAIQQAWTELADIEREQERWSELRTHIELKLEMCRQRGVALEDVMISCFCGRYRAMVVGFCRNCLRCCRRMTKGKSWR